LIESGDVVDGGNPSGPPAQWPGIVADQKRRMDNRPIQAYFGILTTG